MEELLYKIWTKFKKAIIIAVILFISACSLYGLSTEYIALNQWGIKERSVGIFGLKKGILEKEYTCKIYLMIPFIESMHKWPKDIQALQFKKTAGKKIKGVTYQPQIRIQTSDRFWVDADMSVLFKITSPSKVIDKCGPGDLYLDKGIIPQAAPTIRGVLGQLKCEDFYNTPLRISQATKAKKELNKVVAEYGIEATHIFIRKFEYHPDIQKRIKSRVVKTELFYTNQSEEKAKKKFAELEKIIAEGTAAYNVKIQEGTSYVTEKNAERDLYVAKKAAEGNLLIKQAHAEVTEAKNKALEGKGSDELVALDAAQMYKSVELVVIGADDFNPMEAIANVQNKK
jgi:regulator of protease activity HflC (stomatin/prohibitin superfamily)